jgi:hypothetical protein
MFAISGQDPTECLRDATLSLDERMERKASVEAEREALRQRILTDPHVDESTFEIPEELKA